MTPVQKLVLQCDTLLTHARSIMPSTPDAKSELHQVVQNLINMNEHLVNELCEVEYDLNDANITLEEIRDRQMTLIAKLIDNDAQALAKEVTALWPDPL